MKALLKISLLTLAVSTSAQARNIFFDQSNNVIKEQNTNKWIQDLDTKKIYAPDGGVWELAGENIVFKGDTGETYSSTDCAGDKDYFNQLGGQYAYPDSSFENDTNFASYTCDKHKIGFEEDIATYQYLLKQLKHAREQDKAKKFNSANMLLSGCNHLITIGLKSGAWNPDDQFYFYSGILAMTLNVTAVGSSNFNPIPLENKVTFNALQKNGKRFTKTFHTHTTIGAEKKDGSIGKILLSSRLLNPDGKHNRDIDNYYCII